MIRLIAFDLDGTALNGPASLSAGNEAAMRAAAERGIYIVPATGRVKNFIPPCLTDLPYVRYAITSNGGAVWDIREDRLVCANRISTEAALRVQKILDAYPVYVEHYIDGGAVSREGDLSIAESYFGIPKEKLYFLTKDYTFTEDFSALLRETGAQPEKINIMFLPPEIQSELLGKLKADPGVSLTYSNVDNIEINAADCDKGTALLQLAAFLGVKREETMALGDNGNDLGMLRAAGFAAVVASGIEAAKAEADAIVAPCLEDGVAEAIRRFALGEKI